MKKIKLVEESLSSYKNSKLNEEIYETESNEIFIVINSDIKTDNDIFNLLDSEYMNVSFIDGIKDGQRIISVDSPDATIEDISDDLFEYIENGIIESIDQKSEYEKYEENIEETSEEIYEDDDLKNNDLIDTIDDIYSEEDINDDLENENISNINLSILRNLLISPEYNRETIMFRIKNNNDILEGVPMAELKDSFLFKIDNKLKKIKTNDIILL